MHGGVLYIFCLSWNAASSTLIGRKKFLTSRQKKSCPKCLIHFLEITLQSQKQRWGWRLSNKNYRWCRQNFTNKRRGENVGFVLFWWWQQLELEAFFSHFSAPVTFNQLMYTAFKKCFYIGLHAWLRSFQECYRKRWDWDTVSKDDICCLCPYFTIISVDLYLWRE